MVLALALARSWLRWCSNSAAISRFRSAFFNSPSRPSWRITEAGSWPASNSSISSFRMVMGLSKPSAGLTMTPHTRFLIGSERQMQRFKSSRQAQDFLSAHSFIYGHFRPRRHRLVASDYREIRSDAFNLWQQETCGRMAA